MKLVNYDFLIKYINEAPEITKEIEFRTRPEVFEKTLPNNWDSLLNVDKIRFLSSIEEYMGAARVLTYNKRPLVGKKLKRLKSMFGALGIKLVSFHNVRRTDNLEEDVERLDNSIQHFLKANIPGYTSTSFIIVGEDFTEEFMSDYINHGGRMPYVVNSIGFALLQARNQWDVRLEWKV